MDALESFQQPFWLFRMLDHSYYVGTKAFTDNIWNTIFDNLSKYPDINLDVFGTGDDDAKRYIRQRLACLLPDGKSHYGFDQISVWASLITSPLTVLNDNLQKVVDMESSRHPSPSMRDAAPNSRGFFVCSWAMSVSEFDILYNCMKKEEKTFYELVTWDTFIANRELGPDDRIIIRYIGSCVLSEWPIANIYEQTEDEPSGILSEFSMAVTSALPTVAEACQCHLIRNITTLAEDEAGFHKLVHSILIEFFGASFVLNRHPDSKASECLTKRTHILDGLDLRLGDSVPDGGLLDCPLNVIAKLQIHFNKMLRLVSLNREATGTHNDLQLDLVKLRALLNKSIPQHYKRNRSMVIAARGMHINEFMHGRPFTCRRDNQFISQIFGGVKNEDSHATYAAPFAYYYLVPWPRPDCLGDAITFMWDYFKIVRPLVWVTFGKGMAACVVRKCVFHGIYTTDAYLGEIGQPVIRRVDKHSFIHVPLLDPSRCRYGVDHLNEAAAKFMQTSLWNAMLVAEMVMRVLDNPEAVELEMAVQTDSGKGCSDTDSSTSEENKPGSADTVVRGPTGINESEAICRLAMQSYQEFFATDAGRAFSVELKKDFRVLDKVVEKEPLFIP